MYKRSTAYEVRMTGQGKAEMYLYGPIGNWEGETSSGSFVSQLKELEKTCAAIDLRINSGGGSVYEGIAMFNAIRQSKCKIEGYVDGIAASMASVVLLACRKAHMSRYGRIMTHQPSGGAYGTANDLRKTADDLEAVEAILVDMMVSKMGITPEAVRQQFLNGKDNFFSAHAAKECGLVDSIYDAEPVELPEQGGGPHAMWNAYAHLRPPTDTDILIVL